AGFVITSSRLRSVIGWRFFWVPLGGSTSALQGWMAGSPFQCFSNLVGLIGSPNKGLLIFAPALLLGVYAIARAVRTHGEITIFALLVTLSTMAFMSTLVVTADEVWGTRFMHVTIAPLLILTASAWPRFHWRAALPH